MGKIRICLVLLLFVLISNAQSVFSSNISAVRSAASAQSDRLTPPESTARGYLAAGLLICPEIPGEQNDSNFSEKHAPAAKILTDRCHQHRLHSLRNSVFTQTPTHPAPRPERVAYYVYTLQHILI